VEVVIHEFIHSQAAFEHFLAALILFARLGDVGSTYLATPRLLLEANPIVRRLRWPFALLTLALALTPYFSTTAAVLLLVPSLLVASRNFGYVWMIRGLGEDRMLALQIEVASRRRFSEALLYVFAEAGFLALAAGLLIFFTEGQHSWPYVFALGVLIWTAALLVHRTAHLRRLFRMAHEAGALPVEIVPPAV
jgi:hypothetical protein